jgi:hypothetical protein
MPELRLPIAPNGAAIWFTPHLAVSVRPDFAVADSSGKVTIVKLWLKEPPLKRDAVRACLWLLDRHIAEISPCGTPVVVDVRREKVHRVDRRPFKRGFDAYLESEAEAMAALWQRLAALPDRLLDSSASLNDGESASRRRCIDGLGLSYLIASIP